MSARKPSGWTTAPSKFNKEESKTWKRWLDDPNGAKPHRDIGSRSRPMSIATGTASVDELYERMVAKGIVARPGARSTARGRPARCRRA